MTFKDIKSISIKNAKLLALLMGSLSIGHVVAETSKPTGITENLPEFEDVYRIEVIIFTNRNNLDDFSDNNDSDVTEYWNDTPELGYPDNLVFLHPPIKAQTINPITEADTLDTVIELDKSTITIPAPSLDQALIVPEDTRTAVEKALAELPLLEQLEADTFLLKDMATSIGRRSNHQILFHEAWHQELGAKDTAPSIPISGGEMFDDHHELEGSIKINKDRYLHITSDLWLTQYVLRNDEQWERFTQDPSENSLLTAKIIDTSSVPDFPLDLVRIAKDNAISKKIKEAELAKMIQDEALYQYTIEQDEEAANTLTAPTELAEESGATFNTEFTDGISNSETEVLESESSTEVEADLSFDLFQAKETYVLQEHRKMKRAEIHFLDHPMLGLIIQITKYEVPEDTEADKNLN